MTSLTVLTETDFDDVVLSSSVPVLVDFHTEWCGPCKALAPTLESLAMEMGDVVRIVGVDGDESPDLVERFGVTGYPTMILFRDGTELVRPQVRLRGQLRAVLDEARGVTVQADGNGAPTVAPLAVELTPSLGRLLDALGEFDEALWAQVTQWVTDERDRVAEAGEQPPTPAEPVDEDALTRATSWLMDEVEELATAHADAGEAAAIASAAAASLDRWCRGPARLPGWFGALRTVPAARMSPYLPDGAAPADPDEAAGRFVAALRALDDTAWAEIRAVNVDHFPWERHEVAGINAWLCAVVLVQAVVSRDLVPPDVRDTCWAPFAGLLDRAVIESAA